ncbi:hypothetical protein EVAR_44361_1 [Eumeta japonica]|uniref:Uncharacterized protein n=1 Tax=Eumeta variegata TaxID=151549 RepID=A0A4C1X5T6_EUMVA|nr:hypothetical protein EVAR_44361_1 [Eumeta japonica]
MVRRTRPRASEDIPRRAGLGREARAQTACHRRADDCVTRSVNRLSLTNGWSGSLLTTVVVDADSPPGTDRRLHVLFEAPSERRLRPVPCRTTQASAARAQALGPADDTAVTQRDV